MKPKDLPPYTDALPQPLAKRFRFNEKYNLGEDDLAYITSLWYVFGNNREKHTPGGHYFIQEIIEHGFVDWKSWHKKVHPDLAEIIRTRYPQLMVTDKNIVFRGD